MEESLDCASISGKMFSETTEETFNSNPYEEESLETLEAKLTEYRDSLAGVKEALELSPEEPELATLVKDLEELVTLYQDLVNLRQGAEATIIHSQDDEDDWTVDSVPVSMGIGVTSTSEIPRTESGTDTSIIERSAHEVQPGPSTQTILGRTCYAAYEGVLYTAIIINIADTLNPPVLTLEYIGWGNKEALTVKEVQLIPRISPSTVSCHPGTPCWALSSTDGLWRAAIVVNIENRETIKIRFRDHKETISLPTDWVSLTTPVACLAGPQGTDGSNPPTKRQKRPPREIVTPGGYRIPEALRINPQDTERVRQIKKKKTTLLKKEQRRELVEEEARTRQTSWKSHAASNAKKAKVCIKKQSIFSTSDAPEAKVGVTGSGKGMTQFITRSRHIFEEADEDEV